MNIHHKMTMAVLALAALAACRVSKPETVYDMVIRGGRIIDGTGNPGYIGDVGIAGDSIRAVGDLRNAGAKKIIQAAGWVVSPGFIDIHTHCDNGFGVDATKLNFNYLSQGVTTVVTGNCGASPWPIGDAAASWDRAGMGTNAVILLGLGTVRQKVMGIANQAPLPAEMEKMKAMVAQAMAEGAVGISSGLQYVPGKFATTTELIELAREAARFGGLYATHMRSEEEKLLEAVQEAIQIGREAGIRIEISHLKSSGRPNWGRLPEAIRFIADARTRGVEVTADIYPYNKSATTTLEEIFNVPHDLEPLAGIARKLDDARIGRDEQTNLHRQYADALAAALADPAHREKIRKLTTEGVSDSVNWVAKGGWDNFTIMSSRSRPEFALKMFRDLAGELRRSEFDIAADLFIAEKDDLLISLSAMSEDDVRAGLVPAWSMLSSDGQALAPGIKELVHPRNYGTFPRLLARFVREEKLLTLEDAVRKMTSLPARTLRLRDRGVIQAGNKADLVVFDPKTILDRATFTEPHQLAAGIQFVIINGGVSIEDGRLNNKLNGRVLRTKDFVR